MTSIADYSDLRMTAEQALRPEDLAASYERVSTRAQAEFGYGLKVQGKDVDQMALEVGVTLPPEWRFVDGELQDASGTDWHLPGINEMLDLAKTGAFKTLLVPATDRFARDTPKGMTLTRMLVDYGVRVVWGNLPEIDDSDGHPMKRYLRRRMESDAFQLAELEREMIAFRTTRARREKAAGGLVVGNGAAAYGYRFVRAGPKNKVIGYEVVPDEARIVRGLFERAKYSSLRDLLLWLDKQGAPPPSRVRGYRNPMKPGWGRSTVHDMLQNTDYVGEHRFRDKVIAVPAIVTRELFDEVQQAMLRRKNRPSGWLTKLRDGEDPYILRGLLECGHCSKPGAPWLLRTEAMSGRGRRYYMCAHKYQSRTDRVAALTVLCPLPGINAELIETQLWDAVCSALSRVDELSKSLSDSQARRDAELAVLADRLAAMDKEIARHERRLDRANASLLDLDDADDEEHEQRLSLERARDDSKQLLVRLRAERGRQVATTRPAGLTAEEVTELQAVLGRLRAEGLQDASSSDRREVLNMLGIRATVYTTDGDEEGAMCVQHKPKRWIRAEWRGEVQLQTANRPSSQQPPDNSHAIYLRLLVAPSGDGRLVV